VQRWRATRGACQPPMGWKQEARKDRVPLYRESSLTPEQITAIDASVEARRKVVEAAIAGRYGSNRSAVEKSHATDYCGKGSIVIAVTSTQRIVVVPIKCKSWRCPTCGPILAKFWANRLSGAKPQRFITLTGDPKLWTTPQAMYEAMKEALPKFVRMLRLKGVKFEYAAVWELHKSGFPHLHLLQKGSYIPQHLMKSLWLSLGIGAHVHIEPVDDARRAAFYVAKYMSKAVGSLHAGVRVTKVLQISRNFFERTLFRKSDAAPRCEGTVRTQRHTANVIELLVEYHGFTLAEVEGVAAFALTPPPRMTWIDTLALLNRVL